MRLALMFALVIPGLLMLATPYLPLGLALVWAGWWVYERWGGRRRGLRAGDEGFTALLMLAGGIGAAAVVVSFLLDRA